MQVQNDPRQKGIRLRVVNPLGGRSCRLLQHKPERKLRFVVVIP
jgi:hypothetical protein